MSPRDGDGSGEGSEALPGIDFATFVLSLSHGALIHLGDAPDPTGEISAPNLELARQTLDVLGLLELKTRGNLTGQEESVLSRVVSDLRLRIEEVARKR